MTSHSDQTKTDQVAIVMVPFPCHSHLNQLLSLSHLLASSYGLAVHYAGSAIFNHQAKLRHHNFTTNESTTTQHIHFHDFELPPLINPTDSSFLESIILPTITNLEQHVVQLLRELATKYKRIVVIHDCLMSSVVKEVKSIPNAEAYTFNPLSTFYMFCCFWESILATTGGVKPFELDPEVDRVVSSVPSSKGCLPLDFEEFADRQYGLNVEFEAGMIFNTSRVLEGSYVDLIGKIIASNGHHKRVFAIGPFNVAPRTVEQLQNTRHSCLDWLNQQAKDSVIYISFGTTTSMSDEQISELAIGLERSGQKFIWVVKNPDYDYTNTKVNLPQGFEERQLSNKQGVIVRDWAPQLEILAHPSTGGFMSHCGWGSCLESIDSGVPIAAWPMHSDQPINSVLVTEVLKIGVLVREWSSRAELVRSSMVESVVRRLMISDEGEKMRRRAKEVEGAIKGSLTQNGASSLEMDSFVAHITR